MADNDDEQYDDPAVLAQKAFSVYCDRVLRDAVEKNEQVQALNDSMETTREKLIHMVIYNGSDNEILKINLENPVNCRQQEEQEQHQQQNDDASYLVYDVDSNGIQLPYDDIPGLTYTISNVSLSDGGMLSRFSGAIPRLIVKEDETVQIEFFACSDVKIIATLSNFAGTIEAVQEMIDSNRFMMQFSMMGWMSAETGQHFRRSIDNSLDGAVASLKTVVIKKNFIHDVVLISEQVVSGECLDQEDDELQVLSTTHKKHQGLFKAVKDRKELQARKMLLQESRDLFQTITGHTPLDNTVQFQLRLDQGCLDNMVDGEEPAWVIQPSNVGVATMEFSAIAKLRLQLANIPWGSSRGPAFTQQPRFSTDGRFMILKYTPHVEAVFYFDASLEHVDMDSLQHGLFQHVYMALVSPEEYQGPHFTMKLVSLHVRLISIKPHLDALGIDYSGNNTEE